MGDLTKLTPVVRRREKMNPGFYPGVYCLMKTEERVFGLRAKSNKKKAGWKRDRVFTEAGTVGLWAWSEVINNSLELRGADP